MRLRHLAVIILMFAGTIGSAQSTGISLGIEQSNSQVRANGSKYSGDLSGLKLSGRMELAGRFYAHVDYTTGSGKVTASDTKDVSYTEYAIHVGYGLGQASESADESIYPYFVGLGYLNKDLDFDGTTYHENNFPVVLGANFALGDRVGLQVMGFAPIDKIQNNRAADIQLSVAMGKRSKMIAGYTNYSSKLAHIKQCGSGFELSYHIDF
ncbi:MAG: hypothetical protein HN582_09480 [Marinovum sp.]|jgi:hypothetical protein|nr:hypothetical protein [Marinovum sp.]